jgi:lysyl-tRNA synthetase class 2
MDGEMETWTSEKNRLASARNVLTVRSKTLGAIREFFTERSFIEVETPVRVPSPALELHIDAIESGEDFLRTSPELHMKRLLAAGYSRIFQIGPCFRKGEYGAIHNPEYTMLEWYRSDADYKDLIVDAKALVTFIAQEVLHGTEIRVRGQPVELVPIWDYVTVAEAFAQHAGWNPVRAFDAERFNTDLVEKVEPALPPERPTILADYPAAAGALARTKPDDPSVAERWELYVGGIELVNAFSELTDPEEQRQRFEQCASARAAADKIVYPLDQTFLSALSDMPPSTGAALGVDRLVMLLTGNPSLDSVLPFRQPVD